MTRPRSLSRAAAIIATLATLAPPSAFTADVEEIVVTATKREASLQDTALSLTALGADTLGFRDMNDLEDMQSSVPGLSVGSVLGTPIINIRGIGLNFVGGFGTPGVATYYDGIYLPRTGSTNVATVDLERVEVLRGPQGTLYGRNATGGAINLVTKRPGDELGAGLNIGYGSYGRRSAEGWVEGPVVSDMLSARAYFKKDVFDGYGTNEANGQDVGNNDATMGRFSVGVRPIEGLNVIAGYTYRNDRGDYPYSTPLSTVTSLSGVPYPRDEQTFEPLNNKTLRQPKTERTNHIASLNADWGLPWFEDVSLRSTTGFVRHEREEASSIPEIDRFVGDAFRDEAANSWSEEMTLGGTFFEGRLDLLGGIYYATLDADTTYDATIAADLFPLPTGMFATVVLDQHPLEKEHAWAGYVDGSWGIWETLRLKFGLRYSVETKEVIQTRSLSVENSLGVPLVLPDGVLNTEACDHEKFEKTYSSLNPEAGVEWDFLPDAMAYVQFQTGFKAGGFNVVNSCGKTVDPEKIKAVEIGLKSQWWDGTFTLNTALFGYDYTDYQVERINGLSIEQINAAKATVYGAEIESRLATNWFSIDLSPTFLDSSFDDFFEADPFKNSSPLSSDAPVEDLSGRSLTRSPKFTLRGGIDVDDTSSLLHGLMARVPWLSSLRLRVEGFYSTHVFFREFNTPEDRQDAWGTLDAFVELRWWDDHMGLRFVAKNLTDTRYLTGQLPLGALFYRGGYYAPPRTFGGEIDWTW